MKRFAIALGALFCLFGISIVVIPFVVDVDKYRSQILEAANSQLNGKLELGKLSLSLWGQVRISVSGLSVSDEKGKKILSVDEAYFHLPFAKLLTGSPEMIFKMNNPFITVVSDKSGKMNVLSLVKKAGVVPPTEPSVAGAAVAAPTVPSNKVTLPAMALAARLGVELRNASLSFRDEKTDLVTEVKDLNLVIKDISLSRPLQLELWADLDTKMGKLIAVKGPARVTGQVEPFFRNRQFEKVGVSLRVDLDDLEIAAAEMFHKKAGVPFHAEMALTASEIRLLIEKVKFQFHNAEMSASGKVENYLSPVIDLKVNSNSIALQPWSELVPMLKEFELGGAVKVDFSVLGPVDRFAYSGEILADKVTAKAPGLKVAPQIDARIDIATDELKNISVTMKGPGSDLELKGKLVSFLKPRLELALTSRSLDLDQWMDFSKPGKKEAPQASEASEKDAKATDKGTKKVSADFDAMLAPLRENKILQAATANLSVDMKLIKVMNVKMTDLNGKFQVKNLNFQVDPFTMKVFGGAIKSSLSMNLAPEHPTYKFGMQVTQLGLKEAVESQLQLFKNTVLGKANFQMTGEGVSFNPDSAIVALKAKGNLKVDDATLATIDAGKMVSEGLNKSMAKIAEKVPALKDKKINALTNGDSKYEVISTDFTIAQGKFVAPNFVAKAAPKKGIDLKGATTVDMKALTVDAKWEVIDTYDLTQAKGLAVESNGVRVEHILAEGNGPVKFPVTVGCQLTAPCYSYTEVAEYLGKVALGNVGGALQGKAKSEVKKKAESLIQHAPPAVQKGLEDLTKKLFGN